MTTWTSWLAGISGLLHLAAFTVLAVRVIWRRPATSIALSWLVLMAAFPVVGVAAYLMIGETWLSQRRQQRTAAVAPRLLQSVIKLRESCGVSMKGEHPASVSADAIGVNAGFLPTVGGNRVEILDGAWASITRLIEDIDQAQHSCRLLFYIWEPGGIVDQLHDALVRAQERGVRCRVLVDAVGGKPLLKACARLCEAGVEVRPALPVGRLRTLLSRVDLRNHRKLVVIDDDIGYTGSLNMADPAFFKQHKNVGQWVDVMARVRGPSAGLLGALFELDWSLEDNTEPDVESWVPQEIPPAGSSALQVVPSGPGQNPKALYRMLLSAIHAAQERLVMTTPYLVPDEAFMEALATAAQRGVRTELVVPARIDGTLVGLATHANCADLLNVGVRIWAFRGGLLHSKTITVDDQMAVVGTVNLDRRSFWINYELSLVLHGCDAVCELRRVQDGYIENSDLIENTTWATRGRTRRLAEGGASLFAPLL